MPVARSEPSDVRVIAHVDLDCFYVQVEQRRHPELKGKPTAVVMYNPWKGGGIIAVGYEARPFGVTRNMRGDDAKKLCPDINLVQVQTHFGKADLSAYRDAGSELVAVFSRGGVCERASIDEVYLDITEAAKARLLERPAHATPELTIQVLESHIVGLEKVSNGTMGVDEWLRRGDEHASRSDQLLACGAMIIAELRTAVLEETGFSTSAGIAHNKMLAKLASGMHKPSQQTLIPSCGAPALLAALPIKKIKGLGGKLGKAVESEFGIKTVGDLLPYPESKLQDLYGMNTGTWLWRVARGMNGDEVAGRTLPKSHGCGKTFPGPKALKDLDSVAHWLSELAGELQERLDEDLAQNNRTARLLVCHAICYLGTKADSSMKSFPSKSCAIRYGKDKIAADALMLFKRALNEFCPSGQSISPVKKDNTSVSSRWGVTALSLGANNIADATGTVPITQFFGTPASVHRTDASEQNFVMVPLSPTHSPELPSAFLEHINEKDVDAGRVTMDTAMQRNTITTDLGILDCPDSPSGGHGSVAHNSCQTDSLQASGSEISEASNINRRDSDTSYLTDLPNDSNRTCSRKRAFKNLESTELSNDSSRDRDTICTPTFSVLGPPIESLLPFELPQVPSFGLKLTPMQVSNDGVPVCERTSLRPGALICCSPVEVDGLAGKQESACATEKDTEGSGVEINRANSPVRELACLRDGPIDTPEPDSLSVPDVEFTGLGACSLRTGVADETLTLLGSGTTSLPASNQVVNVNNQDGKIRLHASRQPGSASSSRKLVFQRVDELWGKSSRPPERQHSSLKVNAPDWSYGKDEIDQGVLSELPEEMQRELRRELGLKRPKSGKSSISDFFRSSASPAK